MAKRPGTAPGPRMGVGVPTLRRTRRGADAKVGGAVEEGCGFAAVLADVVELGGVVAVVLLEGEQLAVRRGAEAHALLGAGAMAYVGEHHLAGDDELDGAIELTGCHRAEG